MRSNFYFNLFRLIFSSYLLEKHWSPRNAKGLNVSIAGVVEQGLLIAYAAHRCRSFDLIVHVADYLVDLGYKVWSGPTNAVFPTPLDSSRATSTVCWP